MMPTGACPPASHKPSPCILAQDPEGDAVFWRLLGASHGTASLSRDGQSLLFTPDAGYAGQALVRL